MVSLIVNFKGILGLRFLGVEFPCAANGISLQGGEGGYAAELFLHPRRAAVETARGRASL